MKENYRQADPRWKNKKLGKSQYTMENYGCLTTICARIASWVEKKDITPGRLCDWLSDNRGYVDGLLVWDKLEAFCVPHLKYLGRSMLLGKWRADYIIRAVLWGKIVHFVSVLPNGQCYDPWDGKIKPIRQSKWTLTNSYRYLKKI